MEWKTQHGKAVNSPQADTQHGKVVNSPQADTQADFYQISVRFFYRYKQDGSNINVGRQRN